MTKKKYPERRLLVVSKRRQPTDEGLARLVAALVLYRVQQPDAEADGSAEDGSA